MMLSNDTAYEAIALLTAEDFYTPRNGIVFDAIVAVLSRREKTDAITVGDEITRLGKTQAVGPTYLFELLQATPTAANLAFYARIVKSRATARRLIQLSEEVRDKAFQGEGDLPALIEQARTDLDMVAGPLREQPKSMNELFMETFSAFQEAPSFVPTPWPELNELINGFTPGSLTIVAGRPGDGKTLWATMVALDLAKSGWVAFSELEMSDTELMERWIQQTSHVKSGPMQRRDLTSTEYDQIAAARPKLIDLPIRVDCRPGVTVQQVKAFARGVHRNDGKLAGVVIDYVGLLAPVDGRQKEEWNLGESARQLKVFAREIEAPVILLAQLSRDSVTPRKGTKKFTQRPPTATDVAGSDKLLQHADTVIMLQRGRDEEGKSLDTVDMHVVKARKGRQGKRTFRFDGATSRIESNDVPLL